MGLFSERVLSSQYLGLDHFPNLIRPKPGKKHTMMYLWLPHWSSWYWDPKVGLISGNRENISRNRTRVQWAYFHEEYALSSHVTNHTFACSTRVKQERGCSRVKISASTTSLTLTVRNREKKPPLCIDGYPIDLRGTGTPRLDWFQEIGKIFPGIEPEFNGPIFGTGALESISRPRPLP